MIRDEINEAKTEQTMLTAAVIWTVYPDLTLKQVFELLDDPVEVVKLIEEMENVPDGSLEELKGDLI